MERRRKDRYEGSEDGSIFRIPPYYYIHVLDQNTNVTRVEVGPKTYIRQDNEKVLVGPDKMVTVPPRHFCIVQNPVCRDDKGGVVTDSSGQVKLMHADQEIRLAQDPFPLYPGEELKQIPSPLRVVPANTALRLKAVLDFEDEGGEKGVAGDEWLFEGPGTYIPRKEVEVLETIRATVIKPNQAIRLRARRETKDRSNVDRVTGEEWLVKRHGAYLPGAYEEVVDVVDAVVLTDKEAIHMRATRTFKDDLGKVRKNGEEWLITSAETEAHIPNIYEEVLNIVKITTLTNRQYCVILDPVGDDGKPQLGQKKLVKGEKSFFLRPGEKLDDKGIQNVYILGEDEALILRATDMFDDEGVKRKPGDRWMIRGPGEYVPPVEVSVLFNRKAIPLDANEGIYVRDIRTGRVRAEIGTTYMLTEHEEQWNKDLPPVVEELITQGKDPLSERGERGSSKGSRSRDKTKVVTFRVPHNAAVQIYDYKEKKARVVFGPDLVMLLPDEQFTVLSLSGGKPKKPNVIKALCLLLGPDFCTDIVVVETADHARLSLQLSYNWHFDVSNKAESEAAKLFSVPDFVGDACKAIASRIRGAVASVKFDDFHKAKRSAKSKNVWEFDSDKYLVRKIKDLTVGVKPKINSAKIIRASVFGLDENMKVRSRFTFPANNLNITSIDIQSVEPVDQRTRDALQKSVQLAIEITTASQEAAARHEADRLEQEARGRLERQKINDEAEAEKARRDLLELQSQSAAVESTGQAKAEAQSRAEAARIEGEAAVQQAQLKAEALKIESESELTRLTKAREAETKFIKEQNDLEIEKERELSAIDTGKFKHMVDAIGSETIRSIACSGQETQVKLLQSLGLQSTLITDGSSPINLFQTAQGLIGPMQNKRPRTESS